MVDPSIMCDQHLLGEHFECHQIVGSIAKKRWTMLNGLAELNPSAVETASVYARHDELAQEMELRGMNHQSPLPEVGEFLATGSIDRGLAHDLLLARCEKCRERAISLQQRGF